MVILLQITILLFLIQMSRMHTNTSFKKKGKAMREEGGKQRKREEGGGGKERERTNFLLMLGCANLSTKAI